MGTLKYEVWSWTADTAAGLTLVGAYFNRDAALAAANAAITGEVVGALYTPIVGSEGAVSVTGVNPT